MRIVVVYNSSNAMAVDASVMVSAYAASQGFECTLISSSEGAREPVRGYDLMVALGGDGTILRAAHLASADGTPILGINYGHLGFLANKAEDGVIPVIAAALAGDTPRDVRTNLRVDILCEGDDEDAFEAAAAEAFVAPVQAAGAGLSAPTTAAGLAATAAGDKAGDVPMLASGGAPADGQRTFFALNEVALARGTAGRIVQYEMSIAGAAMGQVRGDGVIVSSATGSTAYALSAGGPLVAPGFGGLICVPIAPHSLNARAVLTDPNDIVEISMGQDPGDREAVLFVDGLLVDFETPLLGMRVSRGPVPTTLLRYSGEDFYTHAAGAFF